MGLNDPRGLATSSEKSECIEILEKALGETLGIWGDPVATLDEALEIDPTFVMGHVFRAEMQLTAMERSLLPSVARDIELAEALTGNANERERLHIAAARAWLEGDIDDARNRYEEILLRYPLDLCALSTVHMADFYMGNSVEMRDRVARARRAWHEDLPGYGYVLRATATCSAFMPSAWRSAAITPPPRTSHVRRWRSIRAIPMPFTPWPTSWRCAAASATASPG
jgi:hypothetical protein